MNESLNTAPLSLRVDAKGERGCRRKGGEGLTGFAGQPGKDQEVVVVGGGSLGAAWEGGRQD